jgi:predicted permease
MMLRRGREPRWRRYLSFWGANPERDLDDEIRFHVEMRQRDYIARGLSAQDAERAAVHRFGDIGRVRSQCHEIDAQTEREMRMTDRLEMTRQDIRYALRGLRRNPGFTTVAVISLALGIGANTAIFRLADALLLRTTPGIADPDRVVAITEWRDRSYPSYMDLAEQTRSVFVGELAAFREREFNLGSASSPLRITGGLVTGNYFEVIGARTVRGRPILREDDVRGAGRPVTVLSHGLWRRAFGGDSSVIGREILLNQRPVTVVGVAAPEFRGTTLVMAPELWIPMNTWRQVVAGSLATVDIERRTWGWIRVAGRLAPGVTAAQAEDALAAAARRIQETHFPRNPDWGEIGIDPLTDAIRATTGGFGERIVPLLATVVALGLLVACANLATLQLARATRRRRELGVRLALGASRGRLVGQLLTESGVLSFLGGVAAVVVALVMTRLLVAHLVPAEIGVIIDQTLTMRTIAFTAVLALATAVAFGLLPALRASRLDPRSSLQGSGAPARRFRLGTRGALVVAQIAVCLALLAGAGLFVRALQRAVRVDTGYDLDRLALAQVDLGLQRYDIPRAHQLYVELIRRLEASPDVRAATFVWTVPLTGNRNTESLRTIGGTDTANVSVSGNVIGPRFFEAIGLELVRGREFTGRDTRTTAPVLVVNEAFARRFWPNADPIGRQVRFSEGPAVTVVGIARDAKYASLDETLEPHFYAPLLQHPGTVGLSEMTIVVGTTGDPAPALEWIRREVGVLDPTLPLFNVSTASVLLSNVLAPQRVAALLLSLFGALTLVLSAVGIYGVLAYAVTQRTREIGIRIALGARSASVVTLVIRTMTVLILAGIGLGVALAYAGAKALSALLPGFDGTDSVAFVGAVVLMGIVAFVAAWVPARRAARVDPLIALRAD